MAGRVTLDELYVLVPSAEDYDLAEEAQVERLHAWLVREYADLLGRAEDEPHEPYPGAPLGAGDTAATPAAGEEDDPAHRPTDAQALGCLEHLLGARVMPPDEDDGASPTDGPTRDAEDPAG